MSRFRLAWIQVRSQIGQLAVAIIVIALGVALSAGMLLANAALRESFEESIDALAGRADLVISPISGGTMDEGVLEKVRRVAGVEAAAPILVSDAILLSNRPIRVRIVGVDTLDDATVRVYGQRPADAAAIEDPLIFVSQQDSVIAPTALLSRASLKLGSTVDVDTVAGRRRLVIRGALDSAGIGGAFGGDILVMDLYAAQIMLGAEGRVSGVDVALKDPLASEQQAAQLRRMLPAHIAIKVSRDQRSELARTVDGFQAMLNSIAFSGLLLAALITANRLATLYQQRIWETGILRGMGWTPRGLVVEMLGEATLLSGISVALGLPLGLLLAGWIVAPVSETMSLNLQRIVQPPPVDAKLFPLAVSGAGGLLAGLLSTWLPARRAARTSLALLRSRADSRRPHQVRAWRRMATVAVPVVAAGSFLMQTVTGSASVAWIAVLTLVCAAGLLVRPGLKLLSQPLAQIFGAAAHVGLRDQSRGPGRATGVAGVLLAGVGLVVWIGTTGSSFERFVTETVVGVRQGDLVVDAALDEVTVGQSSQRLPESILGEIASLPGVRAVGADAVAVLEDSGFGVLAVDSIRLQERSFGRWNIKQALPDALERVAKGQGILVDPSVLDEARRAVGDEMVLTSPTGALALPILGILRTSFHSPKGSILLSRELYRDAWDDRSILRAYVLLSPSMKRDAARETLREELKGRYTIRVLLSGEFNEWIAQSVRRGFAFLGAMVALATIVVFLGSADGLAANVLERMREIGTLRSLGYPPSSIWAMVVAQSVAIGVVGGTLAVGLGTAASVSFVKGILQSTLGWELEAYPAWGAGAAAGLLGVVACIAGASLPAWRAGRVSVIAALRAE